MKIAVVKTGGKQYVAKEGDILTIEKLSDDLKEGDSVTFEEILLTDDGKTVTVGEPTVSGAKVTGTVTEVGRGKKKIVFRYKAKSNRTKLKGHRQPFTKVKIDSV